MTFFTIPLSNTLPFYKFKITLSGTIFSITMQFNGRTNNWMMNISDSSENLILGGIPVLIERNMTGQYTTLAVPAGTLFCTDDTGKDTQPSQFSFGITNTMWYVA